MTGGQAAGFWSYVHADDDREGGRVLRLAKLLENEFGLLTASPLSLFVDRQISWGDDWRRTINEALSDTVFFIPVVTPAYFQSQECRKELVTFHGAAKSLGREEWLLPILYSDVAELHENEPDDEAIALVKRTQWVDWRRLRLAGEDSSEHRQAVHELAVKLKEISDRPPPPQTPSVPPTRDQGGGEGEGEGKGEVDGADEDELGFIDLMAQAEDALPRWNEALETLTDVMDEIAGLVESATKELNRPEVQRRGFAGRLAVARRLAKDLDEPANRTYSLGQTYARELVAVDPGVLALIEHAHANPEEGKSADAQEAFDAILNMALASREATGALRGFVASLDEVASFSRDLKAPLRRIKQGMQFMLDGQAVLDQWEAGIRHHRASLDDEDIGSSDIEDDQK